MTRGPQTATQLGYPCTPKLVSAQTKTATLHTSPNSPLTHKYSHILPAQLLLIPLALLCRSQQISHQLRVAVGLLHHGAQGAVQSGDLGLSIACWKSGTSVYVQGCTALDVDPSSEAMPYK